MSVRANRSVALNSLSFVLQEVSFFVFVRGQAKREKRKERIAFLKTQHRGENKGKQKNDKDDKNTNVERRIL